MGHKYRRKNQRRRLDRRTKGMTPAQRRGWRLAEQTAALQQASRTEAFWYKRPGEKWHHRVKVWDGQSEREYEDGHRVYRSWVSDGDEYLDGYAVWSRVLGTDEIENLYLAGRGDIIPASFADDHLLPLPRSVFRR